jgi:hypothetical protein
MMSIGTSGPKLEDTGFSFGSAMSCTPIPIHTNDYHPTKLSETTNGGHGSNDRPYHISSLSTSVRPPDGGLQDVGTSFGSLSLADGERERIIADADRDMTETNVFLMHPPNRSSPDQYQHHTNHLHHTNYKSNNMDHSDVFYDTPIPTTLLHQQKSRGSLLDANDHDDNDEKEGDTTTSAEARSQKGVHEWNMLQATVAMQDESVRNVVSVPPMYIMNPTTTNSSSSYPTNHQQINANLLSGHNNDHQSNLDIPTTLDRDYSQLSTLSVGDDFEPQIPPTHTTTTATTATTMAAYSNHQNYNRNNHPPYYHQHHHHQDHLHHHLPISNNSIENDPHWEPYESSIHQVVVPPPALKKSCTHRY